MAHILLWLALQELLAGAWLLLAWPLFRHWPDRGFGVSKAAGILALAAPAWLLAWHANLALTPAVCWVLVGALVTISAVVAFLRRNTVADTLSGRIREWLVPEALWLIATMAFLALRAANPAITGGEKFMDFGLLNAAIRSPTLPIQDPWLSGFTLNYYHFGFVTWASVARMLGTPAAIAYNLAAAVIPGQVAACAYSMALLLTRSRSLACVSAIALIGLGNLAGAQQVASLGSAYDVWSPSRVIAGTINEFPFFTFFWADLHPHLMAMPNYLVFVALALVAFDDRSALSKRGRLVTFALLGASGGIAAATSPWDVLPLGVILATVLVARPGRLRPASDALVFVVVALAIVLPFVRTMDAGGVRAGVATAHSPLAAFLLVQAPWILPPALLLGGTVKRWTAAALGVTALVISLLSGSVTVAALTLLTALAWDALRRTRQGTLLLIAPAVTMLLFAELFYVDDLYGPSLQRMNSVFKFHLHAILLMAVGAGACLQALWEERHGAAFRGLVLAIVGCAALGAAVYPVGAVGAATGRNLAPTLDGTRYLDAGDAEDAGDRALIQFLTANVKGMPVIAEATGGPYSYAARISSNTGLPTVLGWANHERVWRRSAAAGEEITRRAEAVRALYEESGPRAADVIREFHVRYVVVGGFERRQHPKGDFAKFEGLGRRVFENGGTALFELGSAVTGP